MSAPYKPGTRVVVSGRLGTIQRPGTRGGATGYYVFAPTGDPGTRGGYPSFAPDWTVRLAVIGDTVCATPRGDCYCGRLHVDAITLAGLPT